MKIRITSFEESERAIRAVRDVVFGQEQAVARDLNWDGRDSSCIQVVATDERGNGIGVGRMDSDGKIGRMAVLPHERGCGVGRAMLNALVEYARTHGMAEVYVHAQMHATPFYEQHGFQKKGQVFLEAGIRHIHMRKPTRDHPMESRNAEVLEPLRET